MVDDDPLARCSHPPLTTIRVDLAAEARRLTDAVLSELGRSARAASPAEGPFVDLVVRDST
ncbi:substrate-binding domain-containing protein [Saccharopolyspora sp. NPDC003752]